MNNGTYKLLRFSAWANLAVGVILAIVCLNMTSTYEGVTMSFEEPHPQRFLYAICALMGGIFTSSTFFFFARVLQQGNEREEIILKALRKLDRLGEK